MFRGDAIYDTQYWFVAAEDDASDLRFVRLSFLHIIFSLTSLHLHLPIRRLPNLMPFTSSLSNTLPTGQFELPSHFPSRTATSSLSSEIRPRPRLPPTRLPSLGVERKRQEWNGTGQTRACLSCSWMRRR